VISDGSTDATNDILVSWGKGNQQTVVLPEHGGKANALNQGIAKAKGEIVVFADARQIIAADALKNMLANFADPSVGCVSGDLMLSENLNCPSADGVGMYWQLEKRIRYWEGLVDRLLVRPGLFTQCEGICCPPFLEKRFLTMCTSLSKLFDRAREWCLTVLLSYGTIPCLPRSRNSDAR